jgi:hypothetical protein
LKALLAVYLKALSTHQDTSGGYESNASSLKPPFHALLRRLRPSCETKLLQLVYEDEKALAEMSETIAVDVSSRNFPKVRALCLLQRVHGGASHTGSDAHPVLASGPETAA